MKVQGKTRSLSPGHEIETTAAPETTAHPKSKLVFYIPLFTAFASVALFLVAVSSGWLGEAAQVGTDFGEASRSGWIKQPVNTLSSLGFVFTGLFMGWRLMRGGCRQNANPLTRNTFFSAFFASLVVCVGPGSMAMHATETIIGGQLDLLSMYLVSAFLTAYAVERFFRLRRIWFWILFGAVVVLSVSVEDLHYSLPLVGNFGEFIFGLFIITAILLEALHLLIRKANHDWKWFAFCLGSLLLAFFIWNLSQPDIPSYSVFQGHAVWHLLCAVSVYCLFNYYVSEKPCLVSARIPVNIHADPYQEQTVRMLSQQLLKPEI